MKILTRIFCIAALAVGLSNVALASDDKVGPSGAEPAPSPSNTEVVFSADFDGRLRLWSAGIDGSNLRKLSRVDAASPVLEMQPNWSPNGRFLAYVVVDSNNVADIWVVQRDGTYATQLTARAGNNTNPAWSPDGQRIAFVSDRSGTKDIWIMNADGSGQAALVALPGEENSPSFSPAGDRLVFSESNAGVANLMVANADGTGVRAITSGNYNDFQPNWGRAGIVFTANRDTSGGWKLWTVQGDGSGLRQLGDVRAQDPKWSADGRVFFTNETMPSRALASVSVYDPSRGISAVVVDVQGFFTPIDIRPTKAPNLVNPRSHGRLEVGILSTPRFDATKLVDQRTITFGRTGSETSLFRCSRALRDLNRDGLPDLSCRFLTGATGFQANSTTGILRFVGTNGIPYEGRDAITITNNEDPDDLKDE